MGVFDSQTSLNASTAIHMLMSELDKTVECVKTDSFFYFLFFFFVWMALFSLNMFVSLKGKAILIKIVSEMKDLENDALRLYDVIKSP